MVAQRPRHMCAIGVAVTENRSTELPTASQRPPVRPVPPCVPEGRKIPAPFADSRSDFADPFPGQSSYRNACSDRIAGVEQRAEVQSVWWRQRCDEEVIPTAVQSLRPNAQIGWIPKPTLARGSSATAARGVR